MTSAVPYDQLVRFAAAHDKISVLSGRFEKLDKQLSVWIGDQLGFADLPGEYAEHVLEEFNAAVDQRLGSEGDDA